LELNCFLKFSYRANLWALKKLGVDVVLATTAVGSLAEDFPRGTLVVFGINLLILIFKSNLFYYNLDNYIDTTKFRSNTFYDHAPGHLQGFDI